MASEPFARNKAVASVYGYRLNGRLTIGFLTSSRRTVREEGQGTGLGFIANVFFFFFVTLEC